MIKVSVVIPVYNEALTVEELINKVRAVPFGAIAKEIIIVDDCSTDSTREKLKQFAAFNEIKIVLHQKNRGKGACLKTGFAHASGNFIIIQDADLEYNPAEYPLLLAPLLNNSADIVYGSRFLKTSGNKSFYTAHYLANKFLTLLSNLFTRLKLTDVETCYKAFRKEVLNKINLREDRFGFEPEFTAKAAKQKFRISEVGISYFGRAYNKGKKIGFQDGLDAIGCILKYNLLRE